MVEASVSSNGEFSTQSAPETGSQPQDKIKKLARKGRWRELIQLLNANDDLTTHPRVPVLWLRAATELADDAEIARCLAAIRTSPDTKAVIKIAIAMFKLKQPLQAVMVLETLPPEHPQFDTTKLAVQIRNNTRDRQVRQRVKRFIQPNYKGLPPNAVVHRFPGDTKESSLPPSLVKIVRLEGVASTVEQGFMAAQAKSLSKLDQQQFPTVTEYRDVFVNPMGQIWSADGRIVQSSNRPVAMIDDPARVPVYDEACGCTGVHKGYFEWLVRQLGGLNWRLAPGAPNCPILLRKEQHGLAVDALMPLGVAEDKLIALDGPVFCRRLYVARSSVNSLARTGAYRHINAKLIAIADEKIDTSLPRRFYISRRDSARRVMNDEPAFEKALAEHGIVPIVLSQLNLLDKIRLFRNAELVVGAHGAGFSHSIFARPGLNIVEILPIPPGDYKMLGVQSCFMRLSIVYGHKHTLVLQPTDPETSEWSPDIMHISPLLDVG